MAESSRVRGIRFGTDGWRDVIADGFTFDRVRVVAWAVARYLAEAGWVDRGLAVGYDARFLSDRFARAVAEVALGCGLRVWLAERHLPTPALAAFVVARRLGGGVMVTASHNPPAFNGLKFKPPYGGSATEAITRPIEQEANRLLAQGQPPPVADLEQARRNGQLQGWDPYPEYLQQILGRVDTQRIARAGLSVVADPMHGAAREILAEALRRAGCREVHLIRGELNPAFGGVNPEPIEANLGALADAVRRIPGAAAGVAVDGDADRIGAVDERGRFVNAHQIFALLLIHLVEHRGLRGKVVRTVCTTSMVDRLARRYGLPLVETPVGFKYVGEQMLHGDVLIGGEESGGIGMAGHLPERDGVLSALLLVEMMATLGRPLSGLVEELERRVGPHAYQRLDLEVAAARRDRLREQLPHLRPARVDGLRVQDVRDIDGVKLVLEDGSWLMVRPSGTEPLVRVYAESADPEQTRRLLEQGRRWVEAAVDGG